MLKEIGKMGRPDMFLWVLLLGKQLYSLYSFVAESPQTNFFNQKAQLKASINQIYDHHLINMNISGNYFHRKLGFNAIYQTAKYGVFQNKTK